MALDVTRASVYFVDTPTISLHVLIVAKQTGNHILILLAGKLAGVDNSAQAAEHGGRPNRRF